MEEKSNPTELLKDINVLKKDVYFSYVLKLNHRYVFKDLYSTFERINYINTNVNQYHSEIEDLYKKIDSKNVEFSNDDVLELKQVRRTKEISLSELESFLKQSGDFLSNKREGIDKYLKYYKIAVPVVVMALLVIKVIL